MGQRTDARFDTDDDNNEYTYDNDHDYDYDDFCDNNNCDGTMGMMTILDAQLSLLIYHKLFFSSLMISSISLISSHLDLNEI